LRWRIPDAKSLAWHELDDELVLRNDVTGSTHLLDSLSAELLLTLVRAKTPLSSDELAGMLAAEGEPPQEIAPSIEAMLSEFQRMGIAEPSD
jgi:PqqD family protein of HPr-rel-A system